MAKFDREFLAGNRLDLSYLLGRFMVEHFVRVSQRFDGDLALALVLGTIGQHNARRFFDEVAAKSDEPVQSLIEAGAHLPYLRPCNATSVSASTGIPRETVRRKIRWLIRNGMVEEVGRGKLLITRKVSKDLAAFDLETLQRFGALLDQVESLLQRRQACERRAGGARGWVRKRSPGA